MRRLLSFSLITILVLTTLASPVFAAAKATTTTKVDTSTVVAKKTAVTKQVTIPTQAMPPAKIPGFMLSDVKKYMPDFKYFKQSMFSTGENATYASIEDLITEDILYSQIAVPYQPKLYDLMQLNFTDKKVRYVYSFYDKDRKWIGSIDFLSITKDNKKATAKIYGPDSAAGKNGATRAATVLQDAKKAVFIPTSKFELNPVDTTNRQSVLMQYKNKVIPAELKTAKYIYPLYVHDITSLKETGKIPHALALGNTEFLRYFKQGYDKTFLFDETYDYTFFLSPLDKTKLEILLFFDDKAKLIAYTAFTPAEYKKLETQFKKDLETFIKNYKEPVYEDDYEDEYEGNYQDYLEDDYVE